MRLTNKHRNQENAGNYQDKNARGPLWDRNSSLSRAKAVFDSDFNWLNKLETQFVKRSIFKSRLNRLAVLSVILGLTVLALAAFRAQQEAQRQEIDALRQAAEANWQSDNQLEALMQSLRAAKSLNTLFLENEQSEEYELEVRRTLRKIVYGIRERNQIQVDGVIQTLLFKENDELENDELVIAATASFETNENIHLLNLSGKKEDTQIPIAEGWDELRDELQATAGEDVEIVKDARKPEKIDNLAKSLGASPSPREISYSFDRKQVAFIYNDLVEAFPSRRRKRVLKDKDSAITRAIFSPNRNLVLAISGSAPDESTGRLWDISQGQRGRSLTSTLDGRSMTTADFGITFNNQVPDYQVLATGGYKGFVRVYKLDDLFDLKGESNNKHSLNLVYETQAHQSQVTNILFSSDGNLLATAGADGVVRLWDTRDRVREDMGQKSSAQLPDRLPEKPQTDEVNVARSTDSTISASLNVVTGAIFVERNGKQIKSLELPLDNGSSPSVQALAFSPDNSLLAHESHDGSVYIWNWEDEILLSKFTAHEGKVDSLAFSDDGIFLHTYGEDGINKSWRIGDLDDLIVKECDWIKDYLTSKSDLEKRDENLCEDVEAFDADQLPLFEVDS